MSPAPEGRRILLIHSSDDMYGADRMVLEVIESLDPNDRSRVAVWLPNDYRHGPTPLCYQLLARGISFEHMDVPVIRRRYLNPRGLVALAGRMRIARRRLRGMNPSTIILATSAVLPVAPMIGRRGSIRVLLHMQEIWRGYERWVLGVLGTRADRVIAISEASRESLPGALRTRAIVVPNGTAEPEVLVPVETHVGDLVYVVASRWNSWKGHEVLIKAWDEAGCPGRLIVLGGPPTIGAAVDVPSMVAASRRPDTIEVRGEVPDVGEVINEADVMLVPSTKPEPFGLVTIEAFARGRGVVASAHGGLLETVREGAGWLVEPNDVLSLSERLATLTRAEVVTAGQRARQRYEDRYSRRAFATLMSAALADEPWHSTPWPTRRLRSQATEADSLTGRRNGA